MENETKHYGIPHNLALFIIFIIFILSLYTLINFASLKQPVPQNVNTETLKTYTNQTMGFSVKLPQDWYGHSEIRNGEKVQTVFSYPVDSNDAIKWVPKQEARISVVQYPNDGNDLKTQVKQWLTSVEKISPNTYSKELKEMKIGGKQAIMIASDKKHAEYIYVINGDYTYYITLSTSTAVSFEKQQKNFTQILSSFRFIN